MKLKASNLIVISLLFVFVGCAKMTPKAHYYTGQFGADGLTTWCALDRGFTEMNPIADDIQDVLLLKLIFTGFVETTVYFYPELADTLYTIGAVVGYTAGGWNTYQILSF